MINTLWVFGDSFSVPLGIIPYTSRRGIFRSDLFDNQQRDSAWYNQIKKEVGVKEIKNTSLPGANNNEILTYLIDKLPFFEQGDQVIIGLTGCGRVEHTWDNVPNQNAFQTFSSQVWVTMTYDIPRLKELQGKDFHKQSGYLVDEINNQHLYSSRYMHYQHYPILKLALYIYNFLCKDVIVWHPILWREYENITTYTKGRYTDNHWSPNGNIEFSKTIIPLVGKGFKVLKSKQGCDGIKYLKHEYYIHKGDKPRANSRVSRGGKNLL